MQEIEHSQRRNGFIISGGTVAESPAVNVLPKKKPKLKINLNISPSLSGLFGYLKELFIYYSSNATCLNKAFFKYAFSFATCIFCATVFFNFFSFGTAIYKDGEKIGVVKDNSTFLKAVEDAKKELGEDFSFDDALKRTITIHPKKSFLSAPSLKKNILLCSPDYSYGYTLYSAGEKIFTAKTQKEAETALKNYIKDFSMNGTVSSVSETKIKKEVVKKDTLLSVKECEKTLSDSGKINVVSVVNSDLREVLPFETLTQKDNTLYLGENVVVTEGVLGAKEVSRTSTYKNGLLQEEKTTYENILSRPIAKIVRTGTKQKDILKTGVIYPLKGIISSHFGSRWGKNHEGIDIAVDEDTPVLAAECGTVSYVSENAGGYGKYVKIDHGYGNQTAYAHLNKIDVSVGQVVNKGEQIALSGNTGRSTGPHLHFEIIDNGVHLDPYPYMKK